MGKNNGIITAGELRKMIANMLDDEPILFIKEDNGVGYNAETVEFSPATYGENKEDSSLATFWVID